jgi:transcriptional regulator with XRE-family HTH domain
VFVEPPSLAGYLRHLRKNGHEARRRGRLSRTELAAKAGIGVGYVIKLEQGVALNPSLDVVDGLAEALGANSLERQHLHDLAAYHQALGTTTRNADDDREITEMMRAYVDHLAPNLAGFVDDAWNVLYANAEYSRIYRNIEDPSVGNVLTWFFREPESRRIMVDWETEARLTVAWLRALMVRRPGSRLFEPLLRQLAASPDFVRMWEMQEILMGRHTPYMYIHDLDCGKAVMLVAQVYDWPDPTKALQLYLGVRLDE